MKKSATKTEFVSYEELKEFFRSNGIDTQSKFLALCMSGNRPTNIPSNPNIYYNEKGCKGWRDIFEKPDFVTFEEFKEYCRSNGIDTKTKFLALCKSGNRPTNIPSNPEIYYKEKGCKGWRDIFGKPDFATLEGFKEYCRSNGIDTKTKFMALSASGNRPADIPSNPDICYKEKGCKGWRDIFGKPDFVTFEEFKEYCLSNGISSQKKFKALCKSRKRPADIPSNPNILYKDKGWKGWRDICF